MQPINTVDRVLAAAISVAVTFLILVGVTTLAAERPLVDPGASVPAASRPTGARAAQARADGSTQQCTGSS